MTPTYDKPVFWKPVNAHGLSAMVICASGDRFHKLYFYWAGMSASVDEPTSEADLEGQIDEFLETFTLPDDSDKTNLHFRREDDHFHEIADPGWVPGTS